MRTHTQHSTVSVSTHPDTSRCQFLKRVVFQRIADIILPSLLDEGSVSKDLAIVSASILNILCYIG